MRKDDAIATVFPLASEEAAREADGGLALVGGKGASLAKLALAGLAVPAGFHVTTLGYRRFLDDNDLQPTIADALRLVRPDDPASPEVAALAIQGAFLRRDVPEDVASAILQAYRELAPSLEAVAVRSSATAEDLPETSFAGQQETFLNVRDEAAVLEAVRCCWASLWTARAIGYRARLGIPPESLALAVIVQLLVAADSAGVMFTANPTTGSRREIVLSAAWGLGESVVGGLANPDTVVVDRATGQVTPRSIADKKVMVAPGPEGTQLVPTPESLARRPVLDDGQAAELARVGVKIEALYGQPMDVEWAIEGNRLHVLQARPITALPPEAPPSLDWSTPKPGGRYMRSSVIELLPDPLSPLFATLGLPAWNRATNDLLALVGLRGTLTQDHAH